MRELTPIMISEYIKYHKVSREVHRSSNTVYVHVEEHNKGVNESGYCERCRRVKGPFAEREV